MSKDNIFERVQMTQPPRSHFDLTNDRKGSYNFGKLYPVFALRCMPGDRVKLSQQSFMRAMPLVAPVMHRVRISIHSFFVPERLLWANNENWLTNTKVAGTLPAHPTLDVGINPINPTWFWTELMDHMGLPTPPNVTAIPETIDPMALAAYQRIYYDYYRDQNLIQYDLDDITLVDGNNSAKGPALTQIRRRAWNHDYFTSCLPFAQKGDAVDMPLNFPDVPVRVDTSVFPTGAQMTNLNAPPANLTIIDEFSTPPAVADIFAQTSLLAGSTTINDLRTAQALQKWLERAARGGSRYTEWVLSMYGIHSSDARLNRPEYINGSVTPLYITDVPQNSETSTTPQGNLAGYAVANVEGRSSGYFCEEHGIIMSIMSIMPETAYQQGIEKSMWLRYNDPSELPNPLFMNLGEQEVKVRELYAYDATSDDLFGYIPRFAEDRFVSNTVVGQMRDSLAHWHLGRIFATPPALNQTFIECDPDYRSFAVTDPAVDHFVCHTMNKISGHRPLTKYAIPS